MKLNSKTLAVALAALLFGGVAIAKVAGLWITESNKIPAKITSGEAAGQYNPADIRGSYSFQDVANAFAIEPKVLLDAFGIQGKTATEMKNKDLETIYAGAPQEIGTSSMQAFVALYKGLPMELTDEYLPKTAADILLSTGKLTQQQKDYLATHTVDLSAISAAPVSGVASGAVSKAAASTEPAINGSSTFQQVLDLGITKAQIESVIGEAMPATNVVIRDWASQKGKSFSDIKIKLTAFLG